MKRYCFYFKVPHCHEICIRHLCYLHPGKRNKFYNLSSCDLISNNCNQFLTYLGTTRLSPSTVSFLRKRKQTKIFSISPYIEHAMLPKFKTFWKRNFLLKSSREVVVSIESTAFIFITYSFYFNYFHLFYYSKKYTRPMSLTPFSCLYC